MSRPVGLLSSAISTPPSGCQSQCSGCPRWPAVRPARPAEPLVLHPGHRPLRRPVLVRGHIRHGRRLRAARAADGRAVAPPQLPRRVLVRRPVRPHERRSPPVERPPGQRSRPPGEGSPPAARAPPSHAARRGGHCTLLRRHGRRLRVRHASPPARARRRPPPAREPLRPRRRGRGEDLGSQGEGDGDHGHRGEGDGLDERREAGDRPVAEERETPMLPPIASLAAAPHDVCATRRQVSYVGRAARRANRG